MSKQAQRALFIVAVLLSVELACAFGLPAGTTAPAPAPKQVPSATPLKPTPTPSLDISGCEERLSWIVWFSENDIYSHDDLRDIYKLVTYEVINNDLRNPEFGFATTDLIPYQDDTGRHEEMWEFASGLIPSAQRIQMDAFLVYTDGEGDSLGAVRLLGTTSWMLAVDIRDAEDIGSLSLTLVHETAHLISLNNDQVVINQNLLNHPDDMELYQRAEADCVNYFSYEGCTKPNSYLNVFYQNFWPDIYEEWQEVDSADSWSEYYNGLQDLYQHHEDQFVSAYSVTNPMEDFAESFMYFVFTPKPTGSSISDQKILLFYDYPELTSLRTDMIVSICNRLP